MERNSVAAIVRAFEAGDVRYLIAGGLAVVAHGFVRLTADLDIVFDFEPENLRRGLAALTSLGYRPRAPVPIERFAEAAERESWVRDKGMMVLSLLSAAHPATEVDVFAEPPFDFEKTHAARALMEVEPGVRASFVPLDELLRMKARAGRPQDLLDIQRLKALRAEENDG